MAGLLDFLSSPEAQMGIGLLAAGGPRTDPNQTGFGTRMADAMSYSEKLKAQQAAEKRAQMQDQMYQMQMDEARQKMATERQMRELAARFQTPGQPGLSPMAGNSDMGIMPSAGRASVPAGFDYQGYSQAMAGIDPMKALALQQSLQKESTINKLDVKDFTPASVARYAQTRNYGDLVRLDKAHFANTGGSTTAMDPFTGRPLNSIANTQSPDSAASNSTTMRGQNMSNAVAWANNSISGQRLAFDKAGGFDGNKPKLVGDNWVTAPSGMAAGQVMPAMASLGQKDAREALNLISTARELIPKSTGSYIGAGIDQVGRVFGASTGGDTAAAQLKALEGALVSKMPKMSGPQSDKDVQLYKQMAGDIGDPTVPQSRKLAALQVIEEIQKRNALGGGTQNSPQPAAAPQGSPTMRWNPKTSTLEMVN